MNNEEIQYALDYHEATKHSEVSIMTSRHYLDYDKRPVPFKTYLEQVQYPLMNNFPIPDLDAITAISDVKQSEKYGAMTDKKSISVTDISEILFFAAGITRVMRYSYGTYFMRAASATGALYPIELYIVCGDICPDLAAGVYHYGPADFSLTKLRSGDYRHVLASTALAKREYDTILTSPLSIIFSSFAWRNAWKYQARSYRHWFWDCGVIVANLLATATSMRLPAKLIVGYVDDIVDRLLRLEAQKESSIVIAPLGIGYCPKSDPKTHNNIQNEIAELPIPKIVPLSRGGEIDYPDIWKVHQNSKLLDRQDVEAWIDIQTSSDLSDQYEQDNPYTGPNSKQHLGQHNRDFETEPILDRKNISLAATLPPSTTIGEVILRRGSTRRFDKHASISLSTLYSILDSSTQGVPMDVFSSTEAISSVIDTYFISNSVTSLESGAYFYNRKLKAFDLLKRNASRQISGYLCLGQSLFSDASAVIFLMADLHKVLDELGNRGYRVAQLEAGIVAGKIYLSSYAQSVGASGTTFFDDAVTEFFAPHAANKSTMIAMGVGIPDYKARPGTVLPVRLTREQLVNLDIGNA
ncbi:MAG TPA: SagB/ThcOx family dehydrogenase [Nitrososphaeraceae archaeon]|jgi:SagB-type dehydrogenase family enzyme|nr:SagB/ThcOx family dehydrogenase [Nitrososphaeraceae archaeon]